MAFITHDDTAEDQSVFVVQPSFMTSANDEDPYSNQGLISVVYPDTKRNLLDAINEVVDETLLPSTSAILPSVSAILPPPPQKESLAVFLRVKPKTEKELEIAKDNKKDGPEDKKVGCENKEIVTVESSYQVAMHAPKESQTYKNSMNGMGKLCHRYTFSQIFNQDTGQRQIFVPVVLPKVKDFLGGQNQLIFTYGATSAGKTFTIQGTPTDAGIVPRAIDTLFNTVGDQVSCDVPLKPLGFSKVSRISPEQLRQVKMDKDAVFRLGLDLQQSQQPKKTTTEDLSSCQGSVNSPGHPSSGVSKDLLDLRKLDKMFPGLATRDRESATVEVADDNITYTVWISFVEIYNENIYDLLQKVPVSKMKRDRVRQNPLKLSEDGNGATYVKGLKEISVSTADEAYQLLMIGRDNLHFAETRLNHNSSRSHCIFTIKVVRVASKHEPHLARVSLLSFCDLAGSERIAKTNNVGERQKEAGNINTSLLVLGRCIKSIRHNQDVKDVKKHQMVPYRESKLTRLFKTFFSGLGKASIIICISQAPYLFDESIHVLKFASIASKVTIEQIKQPAPKPLRKKVTRFGKMVAGGKKNSIVAHQATAEQSGYLGRGTINWEAPRVRSTMLPEQVARINKNSSQEVDASEDNLDDTTRRMRQDDLLAQLEDLKEKLDEEKEKNERQEAELREELCKEFNDMLVQVENDWERRVEVERERASELAEWRIEEYGNAVRKEKKRRRDDDRGSDEAEDLGSKNIIDKKEKELEILRKVKDENEELVAALKKSVKSSNDTQNKLQVENTKMQFELAEMRRMLAEKEKDLQEATRINQVYPDREASDDTVTLEETLAAVKEELAQKEVEVNDMAGLLEEAQEEFLEKEAEKFELERLLKEKDENLTQKCLLYEDLESRLEESQVLLQEANNRLEEKDSKIEELEEALEAAPDANVVAKLKATVAMMKKDLEEKTKCEENEGNTNSHIVKKLEENLKIMSEELIEEKRLHLIVAQKLDEKGAHIKELEKDLVLSEEALKKCSKAEYENNYTSEIEQLKSDKSELIRQCEILKSSLLLARGVSPSRGVVSKEEEGQISPVNLSPIQIRLTRPSGSVTPEMSSPRRTRKSSTGSPKVTAPNTPKMFSPGRTRKSSTGSPKVTSPNTPKMSSPRRTRISSTGSPKATSSNTPMLCKTSKSYDRSPKLQKDSPGRNLQSESCANAPLVDSPDESVVSSPRARIFRTPIISSKSDTLVDSPTVPGLPSPSEISKCFTEAPQLQDGFHQKDGVSVSSDSVDLSPKRFMKDSVTHASGTSPGGSTVSEDFTPRRSMRKK